jgi:thiol-disulfide isomerase/thioredoxin|uniref:Thioredoxin domain-containing protein n=1 Tax=viral metagenome TaxID=1070528 RepID=A0A6C0CD13_9ZZZZ
MPKLDNIIIRPNLRALKDVLPIGAISKFVKKPINLIYLAIVLVLLYVIVYYVLPSNNLFKENFENTNVDSMNNDNSTKLVYFYMNGCGHCNNFTPIWDEFCSANSSSIKTYKFEQSQVQEQIASYSISGFPTILLLDENNAKIDEYSGQRTVEALTSYVNSRA